MADTPNLNLPLLSPAQAQKHVTVNEAFVMLDALTNLSVVSGSIETPPSAPAEGDVYLVPQNATDAWENEIGKIACYSNGGWIFFTAKAGWKAWDESLGSYSSFDGTDWVSGAHSVSAGGAGVGFAVAELDHVITAGGSNLSSVIIPASSMVVGVTARVIGPVTGTLSSWRLGVVGADNRYGSGLGVGLNSYANGLTGSPVSYWADTELLLSPEAGDFATGQIRLAVHYMQLQPPREV